jgi:hypothetical protein
MPGRCHGREVRWPHRYILLLYHLTGSSTKYAYSVAQAIAFPDDVHTVGPPSAAESTFATLIQQVQQRGIKPSLHECNAFS